MKNKKRKLLEELKLDLMEVQAYRDLQNEAFCFDGKEIIENDSNISMDAYYEIEEDFIKICIDDILYDVNKSKKTIN